MADSKITALTALTAADPANDMIPIVDVSDTPPASGNTKRISINNILACSPSATLASATITGDLTVRTNKLAVTSTGVGVNYTSPAVALHAGTTGATNKFCINTAVTSGGDIQLRRGAFIGFSNAADAANSEYLFANGGALEMGIGGSTAMTLNATGLGVGVTPSAWDTANYKALQVSRTAVASLSNIGIFAANWFADTGGDKYIANGTAARIDVNNSGQIQFKIAPSGTAGNAITFTQAMTLDASGRLLVAKASSATASTGCELQTGAGGNSASVFTADGAFASIMNRLTSDGIVVDLRRQTLSVGNISVTTTGATFNSTSDYRLKESVAPLSGGLARVNSLKPSIYKWKSNGSDGEGFLAHELAEVVPAAVSGQKDAVNEDGTIKAQSIDMSRIVPILVAAIQELTARVQTLEAR
jgi:hypothetical protein